LGSCFSENIGDKLNYYKFKTTQNPFGILFHPKAIEKIIVEAVNAKEYTENDIFFHQERWHSFDAHSSLSTPNKDKLLQQLNSASTATLTALKETNCCIITLGTSWVYKLVENDKVVANCHKVSQKKFSKKLLSVEEVTTSLNTIIQHIESVNKETIIIFTVSPVRHLKDGFVENTQSKAHLISAIHKFTHQTNVSYFPSYEIMMDELRDYRFYAEDMIHPNKTALKYIWNKFVGSWFSDNSLLLMKEIDAIQKGISHRPFNENAVEHQKFLENLRKRITKIQQEIPSINFNQ